MNINTVPEMQAVLVSINLIIVSKERRELVQSAVEDLARSIQRIGLQTPITVRDIGCGEFSLTAGRHRLAAFQRLERTEIPAVIRDCDEVEAELWEIAENLHRADLTDLQRDEQVARWIELTDEKLRENRNLHLGQVAPNESRRADGRGHRPEGGIRAAARELGIEHKDARRAVKVASLAPEAKQAARDLGLDNNRTALLDAAKEKTPEAQVAALHVRGTFGTGENEWFTPRQYRQRRR